MVDPISDRSAGKCGHTRWDHQLLQPALGDRRTDSYRLHRPGDSFVFLGVCRGRGLSVPGYRGLCFPAGANGADPRSTLKPGGSVSGRIVLGYLCPRVENIEAAVRPCAQPQIVACIRPGKVGDEPLSDVVRCAALARKMELRKVLESRRLFNDVPGGGASAFCDSVVYDSHAGGDAT